MGINRNPLLIQSDENLGALEISTFLGLILYGIFLSQVYAYYRRFQEDGIWLRVLIGVLLFLETSHSFTASQTIYYDTVTRWHTEQANSYPLSTTVLFETLITVVVQSFFSSRIYKLSKTPHVAIVCLSLAFLRFLGGFVLTVEIYKDVPNVPNGIGYAAHWAWLITTSLVVGATVDILIVVSMIYYLRKLASPTNFRSTTEIINRLVRWSLQTGLITSICSILVVISFQVMGNLVWFGVYIVLAKLYSNALLVSLNARPRGHGDYSADAGHMRPERNMSTGLGFRHSATPISISLQLPRAGGTIGSGTTPDYDSDPSQWKSPSDKTWDAAPVRARKFSWRTTSMNQKFNEKIGFLQGPPRAVLNIGILSLFLAYFPSTFHDPSSCKYQSNL